jgi:cytochrome P450
MSAYYVLWDSEIYTDPGSFRPERWLDAESREKLDRYYIAFGRGPRSCVGINLAYAELYTVLATIVRRFPTLSLFETEPEDVEAVHDFFGGMWRFEQGKWGLRVKG